MTAYDYFAYLTLGLAIGVNCLSVYAQKNYGLYDRFGKHALTVHSVIIGFFWAVFIGAEFLLSKSSWQLERSYPFIGFVIMAIALAIFVAAIRQIGRGALGNANFFGGQTQKLSGIYNYLDDPIYWSYSIWFLGLGYVTGQMGFFVITFISVIGLIAVESQIEKVLTMPHTSGDR